MDERKVRRTGKRTLEKLIREERERCLREE